MKLISIFLSLFIQQNLYSFEINSGINKIQLIELYTSESCSSCPPAEKGINKFESSDKLWKNYVPVEFHVDYWNHLHWVDKYSKKLYSKRQKNIIPDKIRETLLLKYCSMVLITKVGGFLL